MSLKGHPKRKICPAGETNCAPIRKRIRDEEILSHDHSSVGQKILRSVVRPNYCETNKRGRRADYLDSDSLNENMCLELEAAAGEKSRYSRRSKNFSGNPKNPETDPAGEKMALTDSDDTFSVKDEDVSNHSLVLDIKPKKTLNKSFLKKTPLKDPAPIQNELNGINLKTNSDSLTPENQTCPICQEVLPDNHSFTLHIREHNASNSKQSHVCQICQKKLSSASSLDRHMYVHSGERPFKCKACHRTFTTNGNMHRHMRTHSTTTTGNSKRKLTFSGSEKSEDEETVCRKTVYRTSDDSNSQTFKCPVCNKRFISLESLQGHMDNHPNDAIECWKCNVVSQNYAFYKNHTCSKSEESIIKCDTPKFVVGFRDINFIDFSSKKFSLIAKNVCEEQARRPSSTTLAFECHICENAFPCIRTLQRHEISHIKDNNCNTCKCSFSSTMCDHQLKHKVESKSDAMCIDNKFVSDKDSFLASLNLQKVTSNSTVENSTTSLANCKDNVLQEYKNIETSVTNEDIYVNFKQSSQAESSNDFADIPSIISRTSEAALPNMRASPVTSTTASPEEDAMEQCPESPLIEESVNSNFEVSLGEVSGSNRDSDTPSGTNKDEQFRCKQCPSSFETIKALRGHSRSHSQNGPHCCDFCPYKSVDKSTLLRHMRTHNGERPFKCNLCDFAFTTKANSHRHVKKKHKLPDDQVASAVVYNPNMLDASSSGNASSENTGETVCKYCGEDFKFARVLRHHLRSVNDSCACKPFSCRNCGFGFSTKNNCIRHINARHRDYKDNVQELLIINPLSNSNKDQQRQAVTSSNNEASTEEDEPSSLHIVESESNNSVEQTTSNTYENLSSYEQNDEESGNEYLNLHNETPQEQNVPENSFHEATHDQHNSYSAEDDRVSIAQSLVSLSEGVTFQVMPLDLSVRAIDLSSKSVTPKNSENLKEEHCRNTFPKSFASENKGLIPPQPAHSSNNAAIILTSENPLNASVSPINLIQKVVTCEQAPVAALPLIYVSQTMTTSTPAILNNSVPLNSTLYISNGVCLPVNSDKVSSQNSCMSQMKMVKKKLVSNDRSYKCEYCDGTFTLKSNRERHVKKQHPKFARPARSRNFIPFLPDSEVLKQVQNVSDTTKTLLRSVLIPKVNSGSVNAKHNGNEDTEATSSVIKNDGVSSSPCENMQISEKEDFLLDMNSRNDFENSDLASVSSVIDTANSQVIKKYLTDANVSDLSSFPRKIASSSESDAEDYSRCSRRSSKRNCDALACEYCNHSFPWISALDRHIRTHTGAKPYICLQCPVKFSTKSNRDRHVKKKCCDKNNYRFHSEHSSNWNSQNFNNGFEPRFHPENSLENTSNDSNHAIDEQHSASANDLSHISNNFSRGANFTASLNTVAHVASLKLKGLDLNQAEFDCNFCQNTYKTNEDLKSHMVELHPFQYQSWIVQNFVVQKAKDTIIPWEKDFTVKKKEHFNNYESFRIQNPPPSHTFTAEPTFSGSSSSIESGSDANNNLLEHLLDVKDSKVIDEIIDCAARTRVEQKS